MVRSLMLGMLVVLLAAPAVWAHHATFTVSGSFIVGDVIAAQAIDACTTGFQQGIDSNCVPIPGGLGGHAYTTTASDTTTLAEMVPSFYDRAGRFIAIGGPSGVVPHGTEFVAMTSNVGVNVRWTFSVA